MGFLEPTSTAWRSRFFRNTSTYSCWSFIILMFLACSILIGIGVQGFSYTPELMHMGQRGSWGPFASNYGYFINNWQGSVFRSCWCARYISGSGVAESSAHTASSEFSSLTSSHCRQDMTTTLLYSNQPHPESLKKMVGGATLLKIRLKNITLEAL